MASAYLFVFDGQLFLFTYDLSAGGDVWRTSDGKYWEQVGFDGWGDPNTRGREWQELDRLIFKEICLWA